MTLDEMVYDKLVDEYVQFIDSLKRMSPDDIIDKAYEKVFKEDIISCFENGDFDCDDNLFGVLLNIDNPLDVLYREWLESDASHMDMLRDTITVFLNREAELQHCDRAATSSEVTAQVINGEVHIGDWVIVSSSDEYGYLLGTVTAIDKLGTPEHETENESDDVHVNFYAFHYSCERIVTIEDDFGELYGELKEFDELPIDDVIVDPTMLIRITELGIDEINRIGETPESCKEFCNSVLSDAQPITDAVSPATVAAIDTKQNDDEDDMESIIAPVRDELIRRGFSVYNDNIIVAVGLYGGELSFASSEELADFVEEYLTPCIGDRYSINGQMYEVLSTDNGIKLMGLNEQLNLDVATARNESLQFLVQHPFIPKLFQPLNEQALVGCIEYKDENGKITHSAKYEDADVFCNRIYAESLMFGSMFNITVYFDENGTRVDMDRFADFLTPNMIVSLEGLPSNAERIADSKEPQSQDETLEHARIVNAVRELNYGMDADEFRDRMATMFPNGNPQAASCWIENAEYIESELTHSTEKALLEYYVEFGLVKLHYGEGIAEQVFNLAELSWLNVQELRSAANLLAFGTDASDVHELIAEHDLCMSVAEDTEFGKAIIAFVNQNSPKFAQVKEQDDAALAEKKPAKTVKDRLQAAGEKVKEQNTNNSTPHKRGERQ